MAISERIKAEARRTIDGMQRFSKKCGDDIDGAEELEHRIARIEASMEGCNGLTQDEKIQKTAENLFELTCAQERSYDALRLEIRRTMEEYKQGLTELKDQSSQDFGLLKQELRNGLQGIAKKIEDSGCDCSDSGASSSRSSKNTFIKTISDHPVLAFNAFIFVLILVFVSGHFEAISKIWGG